ncbi:hypothetical protein SS1G_09780 [Sclerotinia sclerotiorum 1980 UF-70]|uniref:Major facilitator superfamily (MFS) profile domain-containing protein n=1 Tax=Sclerotinia sclerotiorum (strain ATCC 18683 / 1980 / Ss-1) TaxID=665079 RepID=A7EWS1_SCLS1|nr:hypothetical protein SS1G_09780 [Sclerotinia sclerotiorum 1980 UF-70]EDN93913.1 hypothetical protein SS1G_09780 [Sclerotinia sclerotiorum 1980 UF-70]
MSSRRDLEKGIIEEEEKEQEPEQETGTTTESIASQSDNSRNPSHENDAASNASIKYPDSNHEEAEAMDQGQTDLARQKTHTEPRKVKSSTRRAHTNSQANDITSTASKSSGGPRISRITHRTTTPRAKLPPRPLPVSNLAIGIVGWDSQTDPEMPLNFPESKKWVLTGLLASITFISPLASSCALAPSLATLIGFRFMAGLGGSGCLTIGAGMIADLFHADRRGLATSLFSLGPLFGPVIGPIAGAQRIGWRWVFWILFIAGTLITIGIECLNVETNPRLLIKRKVARLSKELNRSDLRSVYDPRNSAHHSKSSVLANAMIRPLKMLMFSPIVLILSLYMALVYGLLYLLFTTITTVFTTRYHWAPEFCGLAYIGLGLGFFLGLVVVARISDVTVVSMTKANNGIFEPEMRLPACIFFACFIPISLFWYGWSIHAGVHWIIPIIGLIPFGFGMMGIFIPIQTYVIDSFPSYAASGIAALTVCRSLFGAFLPLAGPAMYQALGYGWGNSVLGFIALALIPAPMVIYKFGGRVRKRFPVKL